MLEKYAGFVDKNKKIAIILMVFLVGFVAFLVWKRKKKWKPKRPDYPITSPFGGARQHNGTDYGAPENSPILAIESGIVETVGNGCVVGDTSCNGQRGNFVLIDHKNGYKSIYLHMTKTLAKQGDKVRKGEKIGLMGTTGYSEGVHLHLSVTQNGSYIDPETLFNT